MVKAADMLIARRADTRARADFATWRMLSKLSGTSSLPAEAQNFLASYEKLLEQMPEAEATEATIQLMYRSYYAEMGGAGAPPELPVRPRAPAQDNGTHDSGNVTTFRRPAPKPAPNASAANTRRPLPVALIFACLVIVYVGIRYFWR